MAASALTLQEIVLAGIVPSLAAANAEGNYFDNNGRVYLEVDNGGVASIDVTINSAVPCNYGVDHDLTIAVANGVKKKIGVFPPGRFNDASGRVNISYSAVTSVTVGVFKE